MKGSSMPTGRVVDVLNFLAAHPTEAFNLAQIARHVGLSNGSAHRVLTTLADAQFLSRNERHRTYTLGIAMVAIGQAAIEQHRGVEIARPQIARLAVELGIQCSANAVVDGEIVVLIKEGTAQSHLGLTRVGERRPLVPPFGLCHLAWSGQAAIEAYVEKAAGHLGEALREHLIAAFPLIRRRGYAIAGNGPGAGGSRRAMVLPVGQVRDAPYWAAVFALIGRLSPQEIQLIDPADAGDSGISYIAAPVFSPAGTPSLQLVMTGMPRTLSAAQIERYVDKLCATADFITAATHGRMPTV